MTDHAAGASGRLFRDSDIEFSSAKVCSTEAGIRVSDDQRRQRPLSPEPDVDQERERVVGEATLLGFHVGLTGSRSEIEGEFDGEATAFGVTLGPYFVHEFGRAMYVSGYGTLGQRWIDLDMANDVLGLAADHDSTTLSLGLALTGVRNLAPSWELRPELSVAYGYSETGPIDFDATAYGLTDTVVFSGVDVTIWELAFAPEFRFLLDRDDLSPGYVSLTPRVACARTEAVSTTESCGGGLALEVSDTWNEGRTRVNAGIDYQDLGAGSSTGLTLSLEHEF